MSAAVKTVATAPDPLEVNRHRDDLMNSYNPANAHERMLVAHLAQAWQRLQRARELEERYFQGRDVVEIVTTKLEEFKTVTRFVTDCDRAWRHAVNSLEKSQRQRQRAQPESSSTADRPPSVDLGPNHPARPESSGLLLGLRQSAAAGLPRRE